MFGEDEIIGHGVFGLLRDEEGLMPVIFEGRVLFL